MLLVTGAVMTSYLVVCSNYISISYSLQYIATSLGNTATFPLIYLQH